MRRRHPYAVMAAFPLTESKPLAFYIAAIRYSGGGCDIYKLQRDRCIRNLSYAKATAGSSKDPPINSAPTTSPTRTSKPWCR
ncbi:hypothetical protein EVAR_62826_1 [Eumeta japonica]|uniref:Uncharacterized protein n=1 Tax=Eumeta variegata TaxID=151549 RepID=A0A4C2A906_EUMVA|nr:hypothetical protein EVAR_62826_1 [Eumeta japonica]